MHSSLLYVYCFRRTSRPGILHPEEDTLKKRILVLTGSPRKGGNSDIMADEFIKGALEEGHDVVRFDVGRMKIGPCIACQKCFKGKGACVFDDGFNEIAPHFETCDTIVFAVPLYWFTYPAALKVAIDKMYSLMVAERPLTVKKAFLLACCEDDRSRIFESLEKNHDLMCEFLQWENGGSLFVTGVGAKGDILNKKEDLARARELGRGV